MVWLGTTEETETSIEVGLCADVLWHFLHMLAFDNGGSVSLSMTLALVLVPYSAGAGASASSSAVATSAPERTNLTRSGLRCGIALSFQMLVAKG